MADKSTPMTAAEEVALIRKNLGHFVGEQTVAGWLNTGNKRLNAVLGSEELGIAYGKIIEIQGPNSNGKTLLALLVAALAQADGAKVGWADLENSFDKTWVEAQGVKFDQVAVFKPEVGIFGKDKSTRLHSAEELFREMEAWMKYHYKQNPKCKLLLVIDSISAILVEDEESGGFSAKMSSSMGLPKFLSKLGRRWVGKAASYNCMMIFINQIRMAPMAFGNPEKTTGGEAMKFYAHVRAKVRRVKDGRIMGMKKVIGLRGIIKNIKNKAGEGSLEGAECGFETRFGKRQWKFPSVEEIRKEAGGEDE